jgi:hypothetical protein
VVGDDEGVFLESIVHEAVIGSIVHEAVIVVLILIFAILIVIVLPVMNSLWGCVRNRSCGDDR